MIEERLLKPMMLAKNQEKFISPKFKMCHLQWSLECYPNGNSPQNKGSFNLYLKLVGMPKAWKSVTILRCFKCTQTHSGYVAVSTYQSGTSLGWPDYNLSLKDCQSRVHWMKNLKFRINVKILQIRLLKNGGHLFYENLLDPYKAFKRQTLRWNIEENQLHEMKQAYFKKGFVSPIYNNMWCIRCYPNGKTLKGDFLVQLQLCGLPKQANKLSVSWKIICEAVDVTTGWTTDFSLEQSCWGWGNDQLSFEEFKKCDDFEIAIEVQLDEEEMVRAMVQWEKFAAKQQAAASGGLRVPAPPNRAVKFGDEVDDEKQNGPPPNPLQVAQVQGDGGSTKWVEQQMKSQAEELELLRQDMGRMKEEFAVGDGQVNPGSDDLRKRVMKVEKQMAALAQRLNETVGGIDGNDSSKQEVQEWLKEKVKLPQYFQVFVQQGFDDLDSIKDVTKDDLNAMGIDKVGHQRKILKQAELIQ